MEGKDPLTDFLHDCAKDWSSGPFLEKGVNIPRTLYCMPLLIPAIFYACTILQKIVCENKINSKNLKREGEKDLHLSCGLTRALGSFLKLKILKEPKKFKTLPEAEAAANVLRMNSSFVAFKSVF
jgi:hypothetical protein